MNRRLRFLPPKHRLAQRSGSRMRPIIFLEQPMTQAGHAVAVVGAGVMGADIAALCAAGGLRVHLLAARDRDPEPEDRDVQTEQ